MGTDVTKAAALKLARRKGSCRKEPREWNGSRLTSQRMDVGEVVAVLRVAVEEREVGGCDVVFGVYDA